MIITDLPIIFNTSVGISEKINSIKEAVIGNRKEKAEVFRVLIQMMCFARSQNMHNHLKNRTVQQANEVADLVTEYFMHNLLWQSHYGISPTSEVKEFMKDIIELNDEDGWFKYVLKKILFSLVLTFTLLHHLNLFSLTQDRILMNTSMYAST